MRIYRHLAEQVAHVGTRGHDAAQPLPQRLHREERMSPALLRSAPRDERTAQLDGMRQEIAAEIFAETEIVRRRDVILVTLAQIA